MPLKSNSILSKITAILAISLTAVFTSCNFLNSFDEHSGSTTEITSLSLAKSSLETSVGAMEYISVSVRPSNEQKT